MAVAGDKTGVYLDNKSKSGEATLKRCKGGMKLTSRSLAHRGSLVACRGIQDKNRDIPH